MEKVGSALFVRKIDGKMMYLGEVSMPYVTSQRAEFFVLNWMLQL